MNDRKHVVAVCGSLREESKTRIALQRALEVAEEMDATIELIDLRDYELPLYGAADAGRDAGDAPQLRAAVEAADSVALGTPIYHGSYSSPLKTALDYCGRDEFGGTTVGLVGVAGGRFPTKGLEHLRNVSRHINAWVIPTEVAIPNSKSTIVDGEITDERIAERLGELGRDLVHYADIDRLPEMHGRLEDPPTH